MGIYHPSMIASWVRAQFEHVPSVNLPSTVQVFWGLALFALVFASVFFGSYWFVASIIIVRLLFLMDPSGDSQDASHFQSKAAKHMRKRKRSGLAARPRVTWHYADVAFEYHAGIWGLPQSRGRGLTKDLPRAAQYFSDRDTTAALLGVRQTRPVARREIKKEAARQFQASQ